MIRLIINFILILLMVVGIAWIIDHQGLVEITFENTVINTSFAMLCLLIALVFVIMCGIFWSILWVRDAVPFWGKNKQIHHQKQAMLYMENAMAAMASGDTKAALKHIKNADVFMPNQPLVYALGADIANHIGDDALAEHYYTALKDLPKTNFMGLRGLIILARKNGKNQKALILTKDLVQQDPKNKWAIETLYALEVLHGHWQDADESLTKAKQLKVYDDKTYTYHRAALRYAQAKEQFLAGNVSKAIDLLKAAVKDRPDFIAAITRLATTEMAEGHPNRANRRLKAAWKDQPHPDLIKTLLGFYPTASSLEIKEKITALTKDTPDHIYTLKARAEAALNDDQPHEAMQYITPLLEKTEDHEAWTLMAKAEAALGKDNHRSIAMAARAPDAPTWTCQSCHAKTQNWSPLCHSCGDFNQILWM